MRAPAPCVGPPGVHGRRGCPKTYARRAVLVALGALLGASGCVTPPRPPKAPTRLLRLGPWLVLSVDRSLPPDEDAWVQQGWRPALARLAPYGLTLHHRVELRLYRDQAAFAAATGRSEPWLRAFASYSVIHLVPTHLWRDRSQDVAERRLAHELAHVASFHALGAEPQARRVRLPLWFREGCASVIAGQGPSRMPLDRVIHVAAGRNPLHDVTSWRDHHAVLYGAAHHAVAQLVTLFGAGVIVRLLRHAAQDGEPQALERALRLECELDEDGLWGAVRASPRETSSPHRAPKPATARPEGQRSEGA